MTEDSKGKRGANKTPQPKKRKRKWKLDTVITKIQMEIAIVTKTSKAVFASEDFTRLNVPIAYNFTRKIHQSAIDMGCRPPYFCMKAAALHRYRIDRSYTLETLRRKLMELYYAELNDGVPALKPFEDSEDFEDA